MLRRVSALATLIIVAAACSSGGKGAAASRVTVATTAVPATTTTTVDAVAVNEFLARLGADINGLSGTVNVLKKDNAAALRTDCALGRTQVKAVRSDLDDPILRPQKPHQRGALRGIFTSGLDELDSAFVLCEAGDIAAASAHLNAGVRFLNQVIAQENALLKG
jgi:hypothetical protein